jgi:hypothetical protein
MNTFASVLCPLESFILNLARANPSKKKFKKSYQKGWIRKKKCLSLYIGNKRYKPLKKERV